MRQLTRRREARGKGQEGEILVNHRPLATRPVPLARLQLEHDLRDGLVCLR